MTLINTKILSASILLLTCFVNKGIAQNIFPATGRAGIYTTAPAASLQVRGGARIGTTTNYLSVDSATGNLSFVGTSAYRVAGNKYAFQYSGNPNYGLYFNSTNVQYEFRNGSAVPVFYVNANTGNSVFSGNVKIGAYTLPVTDGTNGQLLRTDGAGNVSWATVSGGGGANTALSNLAATAVNISLLPGTDSVRDFGSALFSWRNIYLKGGLYFNGVKMMQYKPGINTIIGENAGSTGSGGFNTAFGSNVLSNNTTGNSNVAIGENSLIYNRTGSNNTATGYAALINNNTGNDNVANGFSSLYSNTTGNYNTAVGKNTLYFNTTGGYNTAVGSSALRVNNAGENTAVGFVALSENTSGSQNTSVGAYSLTTNSSGSQNTAAGYSSLAANSAGYNNSAFGYYALYSNDNARDNSAFGHNALANNYGEFADGNSAFGSEALYANTSGGGNTAMGYGCMTSNTSGGDNTALGYGTLEYNTTGSENVAIGVRALNNNTTGSQNTAIGNHSNTNSLNNLTNITVIGYNTQVDASNKVRIGNGSVTSIGGQTTWTSFSDGRVKMDIKENVPGLKFIKELRPITFHYDLKKENALLGIQDSSSYKEKYDIEKIAFTGFVAQEVDEAARKMNYDFSGVDKTGKIMGLRYAEFVVPLVKAVQELSIKNEELEMKNEKLKTDYDTGVKDLQRKIDELKLLMQSGNKQSMNINQPGAVLEQNIPNPFNQSATINYTLPAKFSSAKIMVTDNNGKTIKQFTLSAAASGSLNINAGTLAQGTYIYSLYVDGKFIDSKRMVIAK